jgi:signal transduction histidine kinase
MSYDRSFCTPILLPPQSTDNPGDRVWIVSDLAQDEEFMNHPDVTGYPNVRFLASSPIISPKGIVIGAYTILDDKPRASMDTNLMKFMSDMARTVMDYLDAARSKTQHVRSERMIVGLGSFLEGKGSLRHSWLDAAEDLSSSVRNGHSEGMINQEQQKKQVSDELARNIAGTGAVRNLPIRPDSDTSPYRREEPRRAQGSKPVRKDQSRLPSMQTLPESTVPNGHEQTGSQLPEDTQKKQVEEAFSRAANIIRESIEVEAAVFFDANFGSHGAYVSDEKSDYDSSGREGYSSASGDERQIRGSKTKRSVCSTANSEDSGEQTSNPCGILGFATSNATSVNDQMTGDRKISISESFLGALLRRYPKGKIFNFSEDGSISSSDTSDSTFKNFLQRSGDRARPGSDPRKRGKRYKRTRKTILRQDAETLLQLAPDSRSIIFSPLWDSHKERWYSASIAWTKSPYRVFTSDDELAFMFAFGNSVMAEVHRLGALFAERAKTNLLAGLSHELRSPLHGIFGMTDLLNSASLNTLQRGFVHTISSCAFTLLGSINQLLEYASIKDLRENSPASQLIESLGYKTSSDERLALSRNGSQTGKDDENTYVQLDIVIEDAIETVFAGYSFFNVPQSLDAIDDGSPGGLRLVLDIDSASDWRFSTRPGAWHVIITNIVGNALKYTKVGYIHVSVKAYPVAFGENGETIRSKVTVTVKDTGCGIGSEFLQNGLFNAFSQENSMAIGNGLGLNITHRTVLALGGSIQFDSHKGVGTQASVSIELDHISDLLSLDTPETWTTSSLDAAQGLVVGKAVGLLGLGSSDSDLTLATSLQQLCHNWFKMKLSPSLPSEPSTSHCDIYISTLEFMHKGHLDIKSVVDSKNKRETLPVIVICPSPRIAHSMFMETQKRDITDIVEFISQPCGPRKLAQTFEICFERQQRRQKLADVKGDRLIEPVNDLKPQDPAARGQSDSSNCHWDYQVKSDRFQTPLNGIISDARTSQYEQNSGNKILIVDDNTINVRVLVEFMKKLGCDFETASNGLEALEFFKANAPSIAMILMGKLEGRDLKAQS